jgi:hypothetical protein
MNSVRKTITALTDVPKDRPITGNIVRRHTRLDSD